MLPKKYLPKMVDLTAPVTKAKWISDVVDYLGSIVDYINHFVGGTVWYHNDTTPYTLALTVGVHTEIKCFEKTQQTTGEFLSYVTHTDSYLQVQEDGHYRVCWDLNFTGSLANHKYHVHLHKNDVEVTAVERHAKLSNATDEAYIGTSSCLDLVRGDQLSLYVHDETANSTITVLAGMIGIEKLG